MRRGQRLSCAAGRAMSSSSAPNVTSWPRSTIIRYIGYTVARFTANHAQLLWARCAIECELNAIDVRLCENGSFEAHIDAYFFLEFDGRIGVVVPQRGLTRRWLDGRRRSRTP